MKLILLSFLFVVNSCFSQDYTTEEIDIPFQRHSHGGKNSWVYGIGVRPVDDFFDVQEDYIAQHPLKRTDDFLSQRLFIRVNGVRFVEMIRYQDNTFFFKEWKDSLRRERDLYHYGKVEQELRYVDTVVLTDIHDRDSLVLDSIYGFRCIGPWEFRLQDGSKLFGNYEHGKRVGTWTNYMIDLTTNESFFPVLSTYTYENGALKSFTQLDKSKLSYEEKLKLLNGKWEMYLWDAKTVALCNQQDYCIYKFHKTEKAKFPSSKCMHAIGMCGTGHTCVNQKWILNKDNTLTINERNFIILYLTEEQLMLKAKE